MRVLLLTLFVVLGAGLAGCGDRGGGGGGGRSAPRTDGEREKSAAALDEGVAVTRDHIDQLRDLNPPADAEDEWGKAVDELDASMDDVDKAPAAAQDGDAAGLSKSLNDATAKSGSATQRAKDLGLKVCSES